VFEKSVLKITNLDGREGILKKGESLSIVRDYVTHMRQNFPTLNEVELRWINIYCMELDDCS
jgi:hypothetical protein